MTNPFREYAQYYDLLYQDKDYPGEALFVARLLNRYVDKAVGDTTVLDLACGTGRHAQELARMGYCIEGSDLSADMVMIARERAKEAGFPIKFHNESFQRCDRIGGQYDAVIAMFSAVDYLTDHVDFVRTLENIRGLLCEGGVFIFDFWNGNAVLKDYSPVRVRRVADGERALIRITNTSLDLISQIATLSFDFLLLRAGSIVREFSEVHPIRYFFPQEMMDLLATSGFEVIHRCTFLEEDDFVTPSDWNLTYVARPRS